LRASNVRASERAMCERAHVTCASEHMYDRANVRPSKCASEQMCDLAGSRGGFGGSPPDNPLACPLPPQKGTPPSLALARQQPPSVALASLASPRCTAPTRRRRPQQDPRLQLQRGARHTGRQARRGGARRVGGARGLLLRAQERGGRRQLRGHRAVLPHRVVQRIARPQPGAAPAGRAKARGRSGRRRLPPPPPLRLPRPPHRALPVQGQGCRAAASQQQQQISHSRERAQRRPLRRCRAGQHHARRRALPARLGR
jgi:hypothetical protein